MIEASLSWWHVIVFLIIVCSMMKISENCVQHRLVAAIVCFGLICVSGLRHGYVDTRAYRNGFLSLNVDEVLSWNFIFHGESFDRGFSVLSAIIKVFTDNGQIFLFVFATFTIGALFWGIYRYVDDKFLGIFLFITTSYLDTMNGMRQCFVSAILFFFLPRFIEEKKIIQYIVLVLLLATVHSSALVFIPIYFIAKVRPWSDKTLWIALGLGLVFIFFNSGIGQILADLLEGSKYNSYGDMLSAGNTSVNIIRIFISAVPLLLSLYNWINKQHDMQEEVTCIHTISFNFSLISFFCWLFATKVLYFYRLAIYFQPYVIILLCNEIMSVKNEEERVMLRYAMIICYLIFFLYTLYTMGDQFFVGYLKY